MRLLWLLLPLSLAACNGSDNKADDGDETGTTGDDPVVIDCSEIPPYDLPSLDCAQLGSAFESTVRASDHCNVAADCVVVHPACETWNAVTCYYAANHCVDIELVQSFNAEAGGCTDGSDVCDCEAPPEVDCVDHLCVFVFPE